ncbi:VOC family protein [bacterium]|nr:VOC family protein [bacterium]
MTLSLVVVRCNNILKTRIFYEALGFTFVEEQHGRGPVHFASCDHGVVFELYPAKTTPIQDDTRLGFTIENLDTIIHTLPVVNTYLWDHKMHYILVDPDGRKIEISNTLPR